MRAANAAARRRKRKLLGAAAGPVISISVQPQSDAVDIGDPASFSVTASVTAPETLSYQWQLLSGTWGNISNGGVYSGATTATLAISDATALNGAIYRVVVSATGGASDVNSSSALLTVGATASLLFVDGLFVEGMFAEGVFV